MSESEQLRETALQRVGTLVQDKWSLVRLIGVGGSAAVYEAEHRNGRRVAIKMLHAKYSTEREAQRRFLQEAYAANRVQHPDVVQVYDDGVDENGNVFLVSELLQGRSLAELQEEQGGTLPPATAVKLICAALEPLAAAHDKGIVHRDLKPGNLLLCDSGAVKLLDFGIARMAEAPSGGNVQTATGTWLGTPAFVAPEQARGRLREVDERSDVWAMGATLFTLLSGQYVYQAETMNEQLGLAMTTPARSLASLGPFPSALVRVVDRALEFSPKDRFPNAAALLAELRGIQGTLRDQPVPVATLASAQGPALRSKTKAGLALVAAALVLAGYYLTRTAPAASTAPISDDVRATDQAAPAPAPAPVSHQPAADLAATAPSTSNPTSRAVATAAPRAKLQPPAAPKATASAAPATNPLDIRE